MVHLSFERRRDAPSFWRPLALFLLMVLLVGSIGGIVTAGAIDTWYPTLAKPSFNPPDWVFGPVWTALYAMMAIAAALVWRRADDDGRRTATTWFLAQLALNLAWPCLFFGLHDVGLALACLVLLWVAVLGTMVQFWLVHRLASLLLLPYLAWVSFAGLLNFVIWRLN